ncbi:MAG: hypothetical protein JWQ90_2540 [Hydrocarboniphaga sp.]|uniref:hypothetical protein n=1 Tax=Hydrocarboniphaga sp. TaxID=2033016 RepID=UPI00260EABB8|nr:hypothetical protein [Hydrocarboniphaga sp.]MDB5970090.1 hypothetical protein [Hydrocarboniphaga sp.]
MVDTTNRIDRELFDRKFVVAASAIGLLYALIVAALGALVGKEVAGVAGVALTALATGIFRQFETLRFRRIAQENPGYAVSFPRFSFARMTLFIFTFLGAQLLYAFVLNAVVQLLGITPPYRPDGMVLVGIDWYTIAINLIPLVLGWITAAGLLRRCIDSFSYGELAIGALLAISIPDLISLLVVAIKDWSMLKLAFGAKAFAFFPAFWLAGIVLAVISARIARPTTFVSNDTVPPPFPEAYGG